jgi:hypothetical protein
MQSRVVDVQTYDRHVIFDGQPAVPKKHSHDVARAGRGDWLTAAAGNCRADFACWTWSLVPKFRAVSADKPPVKVNHSRISVPGVGGGPVLTMENEYGCS